MKWYLLILIFLISCYDIQDVGIDGLVLEKYTIKKGRNKSTSRIEYLTRNYIEFEALFDTTAVYTTLMPYNQIDINKLMGFSDCNDHHQTNSARFGWRWHNNQLEILPYVYNNSKRLDEPVIFISELHEWNKYRIEFINNAYIFTVNNNIQYITSRTQRCAKGLYYKLWPYFGGNEQAPHDIDIWIKRKRYD